MCSHCVLFLIIAALFCSVAGTAQGKITVRVSNFKTDKGVTRICLFNNAAAFNGKGQPVQCLIAGVKDKISMAVFENIPSGTYAVSVFHDVNSNNKMDVNFVGIPKEGYGASKNKLPFASAPAFDDNKFILQTGNHVQLPIKLRHL